MKSNNNEIIKKIIKKKKIRSSLHYIIYSSLAKQFCIDLKKMYN